MLMHQPGSVNSGTLGALMRQPGSVNSGSLGVLMPQPGAHSDGSLGILMPQPRATSDGILGAVAPPVPRRRRRGLHGLGANPYAQAAASAASRQQAAAAKARALRQSGPARRAMTSAVLHGLGASPHAIAARMSSATNRGICLNRCKASPNFAGCVRGCTTRYPLSGLGDFTMPSWGWMAGGVALLGAVAYLATRR